MASWDEITAEAPELVGRALERFGAFTHKTIATLRADGSPRISGVELTFAGGQAWVGMMPGSLKARDLQRDGRFALHSGSPDPDPTTPGAWAGDAKIAGRAVEVTDAATYRSAFAAMGRPGAEPGGAHLFRLDVTEVVVVRVGEPADHLVIESWHAGRGVQVRRRE